MVVNVSGLVRLGGRGNAFAERIESDGDALAVDCFSDTKRVFGLHAGDEARIEACAQCGVFKETA